MSICSSQVKAGRFIGQAQRLDLKAEALVLQVQDSRQGKVPGSSMVPRSDFRDLTFMLLASWRTLPLGLEF